jgi:hypothetical protein
MAITTPTYKQKFDFDKWSELSKKDPEAFEAMRQKNGSGFYRQRAGEQATPVTMFAMESGQGTRETKNTTSCLRGDIGHDVGFSRTLEPALLRLRECNKVKRR